MADPEAPNSGDREWDLIYKAVVALEPYVTSGYVAPNSGDRKWDLLYKLNQNIARLSGS